MTADVESAFIGAGNIPWWDGLVDEGMATYVEGLLTADEALTAAHLDWEVGKAEAYAEVEGALKPVEKRYFTYRMSDLKVLSKNTLSERYKILNNQALFGFMDHIVNADAAHYITAGSLDGGTTVWVLLKVNKETVRFGGGQGEAKDFILGTTTHDGSGAVIVKPVRMLVVCSNTLSWALREHGSTFTARHTESIDGKVQTAREAIQLSVAWFDEFDDEVQKLLNVGVTDSEMRSLVNDYFPLVDENNEPIKGAAHTKREGAQNFIRGVYNHESNAAFRGTGWGAVQAVNGYEQWGMNVRGSRSERQAIKMLGGNSQFPLTTRTRNMLLEVV